MKQRRRSSTTPQRHLDEATGGARRHLATLLDLHTRHVEAWSSISRQALGTGHYSHQQAWSDALALSVDAYATWVECLQSCLLGKVEDDDTSLFDQRSEASGPILVPSTAGSASRAIEEPPVTFRGPGGATVDTVIIRRLPDGNLHVVLTSLSPALPDGDYSAEVEAGGAFARGPRDVVTATKATRARASQRVGFGAPVPPELLADKSLNLQQLLFE